MNVLNRRTRWAAALAALAATVPLATTAAAAPVRTTTTTAYTHAAFLQHALGLPATDTNPAIESVTYDRFQWLLQQSGKLAILIGDPATDASFKARAQDVEAAAKAAGAKKVYWFNPNLSGSAKVGSITEPALDIRNAASVPLASASQTKYGNAWSWIVTQVGDGVDASINSPNSESATVTVSKTGPTATTLNDYGYTAGASTKVGNADTGGALYDYRNGTPATVQHSFFFIYDKANTATGGQPQRIVAWTDLTAQTTSTATKADVTTAIAKPGAANLTQLDQFAWWKDEVNTKQKVQSSQEYNGANNPVLTDADNADGWRVDQITYPELVDVLKNGNDADVEILFGGTWCPNTRPVLGATNKAAQENGVPVVFNFDTVLDGGVAGGNTTAASDPLQSRNTTNNGTTLNANPTYLYGDVLALYLNNIKTQYKTSSNSIVTYYPGGNTALPATTTINKLQVPFVIGYQGKGGDAPSGGITRQWIIDQGNGADYTEYMTSWAYTSPQQNQLGISPTQLPAAAPIWQTINTKLPSVTWATDPSTLLASSVIDTDDADYLVAADTAKTPTYTAATETSPATVSAPLASGPVSISPASLTTALGALGASAPVNYAAAKAALIAAFGASTPDQTLIGNLTTVYTGWGIAQNRKTTVNNAWGNAKKPTSVIGGLAAVHALHVFFDGLPGTQASQRTVTASSVKAGGTPTISVALANGFGSVATNQLSLVVSKGGATVATASNAVTNNATSFTLPALDAGVYDYRLSYPGDYALAPFTDTGTLTVDPADPGPGLEPTPTPVVVPAPSATPTPVPPAKVSRVKASKVKGAVSKAPTSKKAGKYKVTITTPKGAAKATGKVKIKLKKGKVTKTITRKLSKGVVTFSVPKLAKGTWKVTISWPGDSHYLTASATGSSIKVKK